MRYHGIPLTPPVTWPCECAGRKAIRLFLSGLATASLGRHIYFLKDRSGLEAALSAPCPCDALREERDRYMTLAEVREIKADRLRVENMRLKSQLAAAVEAHRQAEAECDTAIRTRNLAQAASTRDLEAKRAAEVTLISCAGENDQLRADLATAVQSLEDCQHECAVIFALVPTSSSGQAAQRCAMRAAAALVTIHGKPDKEQ